MLLLTLLTPFVVLATRVVGSPISVTGSSVSIPITKQINNRGKINFVKHDINRWKLLLKRSLTPDISLNDQIDSGYTANIGVGIPPQNCEPYLLSLT